MDETTNDLLKQLVTLQQESVANQKTILEMQAKAIRRNNLSYVSWLVVVVFFLAWIVWSYLRF